MTYTASHVTQTLSAIDWVVIGLYSLILAAIPVYYWRKQCKQDDLFLAGRSMSRWPVAISLYMALFSTNSFVGLIGWVNRPNGTVWIAMQNVGIISAVPLVIFLFPSLFYRLRITTAYEYLEKRFSYSVRALASIFFMCARIMWMSTMLYAASLIVLKMLGWTPAIGFEHGVFWSVVVTGAFAMFVVLVGGMSAVIWTDVIQFVVVMSGVATMTYLSIRDSGGIASVIHIAQQAGKFAPPAAFRLTGDLNLVSGFMLGFIAYLSNGGADQLILQTYLSGKSEKEIKASLWRNGLLLKPLSLIFPTLGVLTFVYYRLHPETAALMRIPDDALPVFVVNIMPVGIRGLMIAAILSAIRGSLSGGMASLTAALQVDFIRPWVKTPLSDRGAVRLGRVLSLIWGIAVVSGALWVSSLGEKNNILQILNLVMYPFLGVLLGIFLLGLLNRRANAPGTLAGAALGFVATIALPGTKGLISALWGGGAGLAPGLLAAVNYMAAISNFYYGFVSCLVTVLAGSAASYLFAPPRPSQIHGLTRLDMPPVWDKPEATAARR